ncbi:uncharacterized protein LOC117113665 [Anneissia japonica]|uniref:uncharacterized protein LOC117113665 n=1 Tax=Anneissia japonica TaxID=1529436 RepID=UPI001425785C|nr:uncharacterized protein LOC117113665 [Anneissia japonica]
MKDTYLPVVWLNESCDLDDAFVDYYKKSVLLPLNSALGLFIAILVLGAGLLIGSLITYYIDYRANMNPKKSNQGEMKDVCERPNLERHTSQIPLQDDFATTDNDDQTVPQTRS